MRSTIILRLLAQELANRGLPHTAIEGIKGYGDDQAVHHPSLQARDMEAHIATHAENVPVLLISHCIGTVAALQTVEKVSATRPAALVSIAPPLPSPRSTIETPQSQKKRSENNTLMRVVDLPAGALDYSTMAESQARIDPQYFADIHAADNLDGRLRQLVEQGYGALFAPEHDWNAESPRRVQAWHDEWFATLPEEQAELAHSRAQIVAGAAHGLYASPRSGLDLSPKEDIEFQLANVNAVIDTGLELLVTLQTASVG